MCWHLTYAQHHISQAPSKFGVSSQIKTADLIEGLLVRNTESSAKDLDWHLNHKKLTQDLLTVLLQHHVLVPSAFFFMAGRKLN